MTRNAQPMIPQDSARPPAAPADPDIAAGDLRALVNAFEGLGYPVEALLEAAGVARAALSDPDARVPCAAYGAIVERACRERTMPNLALHVARQVPIGAYPLLDYLVVTSEDVGAGLRQLARYFRLASNPLELVVRDGENPIRIVMEGGPGGFVYEFTTSLLVFHMRAETAGQFTAHHVSFRHRLDDAVEFERALGCPVESAADWNGVAIPPASWQLKLRRRDPVLRSLLERQARSIAPLEPAHDPFLAEVKRAVVARMSDADGGLAAVARRLAISPRTLQRRLSERALSYQEIVESTRRSTADCCLADATLSIGEVAYLLGYSEPAAFHRAFKRWFGTTPSEHRQRLARERAAGPFRPGGIRDDE